MLGEMLGEAFVDRIAFGPVEQLVHPRVQGLGLFTGGGRRESLLVALVANGQRLLQQGLDSPWEQHRPARGCFQNLFAALQKMSQTGLMHRAIELVVGSPAIDRKSTRLNSSHLV